MGSVGGRWPSSTHWSVVVVVEGAVVVVVGGSVVVVVGGVVVDVVGGGAVVDVEPDGGLTVATADDGPTASVLAEGFPVDEPGVDDGPDSDGGTDPPAAPPEPPDRRPRRCRPRRCCLALGRARPTAAGRCRGAKSGALSPMTLSPASGQDSTTRHSVSRPPGGRMTSPLRPRATCRGSRV